MTRVESVLLDKAPDNVKSMLETIQQKMGNLPNIFKNMANSPAVLKAYLDLSQAASTTSFSPAFREEIALALAESNQSTYCLSAHCAMAKNAGLSDEEILNARKAKGRTSKEEAILKFAKELAEKKGHLGSDKVSKLKEAGVSDRELVELILIVSLNLFTNYFNLVTDPVIDFPLIKLHS